MIAFFNGRFVDHDSIRVSPDDRGFLFGDGVYEVIRAYRGMPLAVDAHADRLARSLQEIRLTWPGAVDLPRLVDELLARNELGSSDALVYLQVTRGEWPRAHAFPPPGTPPTVYGTARPYSPAVDASRGVAAILTPDIRWHRCDIKAIGLLANVLAYQRALDAGAAEAIFVRDGVLTEGTHTNVCAVVGGTVVTHPLTNHVLPGVTLAQVRQACIDLGVSWREEPIRESELANVEELLLVGTTMEVTSVVRLDGRPVGSGHPGVLGAALLGALRERTRA